MARKLDLHESAALSYRSPVRSKNSAAVALLLLQGVADHSRVPQARDWGTRHKTAIFLPLDVHELERRHLWCRIVD